MFASLQDARTCEGIGQTGLLVVTFDPLEVAFLFALELPAALADGLAHLIAAHLCAAEAHLELPIGAAVWQPRSTEREQLRFQVGMRELERVRSCLLASTESLRDLEVFTNPQGPPDPDGPRRPTDYAEACALLRT